jgi:FKBP-type peptidyl-prolyl cis-trans isomerase FklB
MKRILALSVLLAGTLLPFISCSETKETDDHANWKDRNASYISSIASQCGDLTPQTATEGQMFRLLSYKLDNKRQWGDDSYVYCKVIKKDTGTVSPKFTDSIRINYRVRLMPTANYPEGQVVDRSFMTANLDPEMNIPSSFKVSSLIEGAATAIMNMHCGDYWIVYIPYGIGYGTNDRSGIPGYSALIYEINLTEFAVPGQNLSKR